VIVDCHTHVGDRRHYGGAFLEDAARAWGPGYSPARTLEQHWDAVADVDHAIVLAFAAPAAGFDVPNDYVAEYVARHPEKLIGFASVDPGRPGAVTELERAVAAGLRGLKLGPTYQGFDPAGAAAIEVYEAAEAMGLPVIWHQGTTFVRTARLEYARPSQIDGVAIRFPELRIVIAHLGHPWIDEALVVVRKHPHLFADISALHMRPWQLYNGLVSACEYRVADRLLLGTDWPFGTLEDTLAGLRGVNRPTEGTGLPRVPDDVIAGIISRPTLDLLGLSGPTTAPPTTRRRTA
jgi:predicted TIM-barrel fold metal-dependent hydrolase